jgi:HmuY protein
MTFIVNIKIYLDFSAKCVASWLLFCCNIVQEGKKIDFLFILPILFTSCLKEELSVPLPAPSDATIRTIRLESNYKNQIYFSFEKDSVIAANLKTDWDFSIDSDIASKIRLNQAKYMFAMEDKTPFRQMADTTGFDKYKHWDASNVPDSLSLKDWKLGKSYIVDFGIDETGYSFGLKKVKFTRTNGVYIQIETSNLDATNYQSYNIRTTSNCSKVYFSTKYKELVNIEPETNNWDVCFTQYMHTFYSPFIPYLVVGALTNPVTVQVSVDSLSKFSDLTLSEVKKMKFCTQTDMIGYDWKNYLNGVYTLNAHKNYIIKKDNGMYFKLHFLDFYNDKGQKGYPKFEYKRL